jgi:integrase/recombinase XerD
MVYYKLILNDKREKADDIYPVVLRVTFNRNNTTITSGIRVKKEEWDNTTQSIKRTNPNHQALNQSIFEFYLKVQEII